MHSSSASSFTDTDTSGLRDTIRGGTEILSIIALVLIPLGYGILSGVVLKY